VKALKVHGFLGNDVIRFGRSDWRDGDQKLRAERRTVRRLRKQLKDAKAAMPKQVDKARVAATVVRGLNDYHWDQGQCSGACKDHWLKELFAYLSQQGVVLK
jgi:hypothetical protein